MSTEEEIREVFEQDIQDKTDLVRKTKGVIPFLRGGKGMTVRTLTENLNEVELFEIEEWDDNNSD